MTAVPSALALGRIRPPQPNVDSDIELDRNSNLSLEVTLVAFGTLQSVTDAAHAPLNRLDL
jgi:hypothetical protein